MWAPDQHRSSPWLVTQLPSSQPRAPLKSNQGRFFAFRNVLSTSPFSRASSAAFCEFLPLRGERRQTRRSNHRQQLSPAPPSTMSPTTPPSIMSPTPPSTMSPGPPSTMSPTQPSTMSPTMPPSTMSPPPHGQLLQMNLESLWRYF